MQTEIDCQTISPEDFAATVSRWMLSIVYLTKPTTEMQEAQAAICQALKQACEADRQELFVSLSTEAGVAAMEIAAQEGNCEAIERLHKAGVDCNETTLRAGTYPIHYAALAGHTEAIVQLLDCDADIMQHRGNTNALGMAIQNGHTDCAWTILDRVKNLSKMKHGQGTILESVARHGGAEFVPAFIARGISPDKPDSTQKPPIAYAVEHGHLEVVQALLAAGASPDLPAETEHDRIVNPFIITDREPPILIAAMKGKITIVELLIEAGADVEAIDSNNLTAYDWARRSRYKAIAKRLSQIMGMQEQQYHVFDLIRAAGKGDVAIIESAIAEGVEVDFCTTPGRTALMCAAMNGRIEATRLLLAAGASPNKREQRGGEGDSVWELAAKNDQIEILALFLEHSPDIEFAGKAMVVAAGRGNLKSVRCLLDGSIDVDSRDSEHNTPLKAAASKGRTEIITLLLECGANVELRNKDMFACTALHDALLGLSYGEYVEDEHGNSVVQRFGDPVESVRLLLEVGADPNSVPKHGDIPLQYAKEYSEVTRMLIDAGADLNLKDTSYGQTALHWAARNWGLESAKMILNAGAAHSPVDEKGQTPLDLAHKEGQTEIAKLIEAAGGVLGMETEEGRAAVDVQYAKELTEEKRIEAAAAADEALCPDFTAAVKSKPYKQAIKRLEELTDDKLTSPENLPALAHCKVELQRAEELLLAERESFDELGCTLFRCGRAVFSDNEDLLGILPTTDPFEVIAAIGTAGPNYGVFMSEVVAELRELHELFPFHLTLVRYDTIGLEFAKTIPKSKSQKWAVRLYELCPDLIDQGFLTITKLRKHLEKEKTLTLWWD